MGDEAGRGRGNVEGHRYDVSHTCHADTTLFILFLTLFLFPIKMYVSDFVSKNHMLLGKKKPTPDDSTDDDAICV